MPDSSAVIDLDIGVFETSNTSHGAKVVVECTVFLHEEDDMVYVRDRSSSSVASQRQGRQRSLLPKRHFLEIEKLEKQQEQDGRSNVENMTEMKETAESSLPVNPSYDFPDPCTKRPNQLQRFA